MSQPHNLQIFEIAKKSLPLLKTLANLRAAAESIDTNNARAVQKRPRLLRQEEDRHLDADQHKEESDEHDETDDGNYADLLMPKEGINDEIKVEFKFCDTRAEAEDEMWIRSLIAKGWTGRLLKLNDTVIRKLAQAIAEQVIIGTFVKTEDDDESIYSFATILKTTHDVVPVEIRSKLKFELPSKKCGWLVREQIVNVPSDVAGPLYQCLKQDMEYATTNTKNEYDFEYILILSPCYSGSADAGSASKKKKKEMQNPVEHALGEDCLFAEKAQESCVFQLDRVSPVEGVDEPESLDSAPWFCMAMLLKKTDFFSCIEALKIL